MNIWHFLEPNRLPTRYAGTDILAQQREIILQGLLNILLALYTVGLPLILIITPNVIRSGHVEYYLLGYAAMAAMALARGLPNWFRAPVVIMLLQAMGVLALLSYGLSGTGLLFLLGAAMIASILLPQKYSRIFAVLSLLLLAMMGWVMLTGRIAVPPVEIQANTSQPTAWWIAGAVFLFLLLMAGRSLQIITGSLGAAFLEKAALAQQLSSHQEQLEQRIEDRAAELKDRLAQFAIASRIARQVAGEAQLDALLNNTIQTIRDEFHFYHVGIFLSDERGEYAVLRAATGEAGKQMLQRNHRLKIGEAGIVGNVIHREEARIALDVLEDITYYKNPLLTETRSEMALPLRAGGKTIGALDVQSVVANAFTQEDVQILQIVADQLAIAFQKNRLMEDLQRAVDEAEAIQQVSVQKAWRAHLRNTRQKLAYRYRNARLEAHSGASSAQAQEAFAQGQVVIQTAQKADRPGKPTSMLAVPIKLRNHVLGVVELQLESEQVSPDIVALIEGATNRLAVSLENARLLEEIQFRAERERLVNEISTKVRAAADVDTVLRVAVQEIGQSLGVSEVAVRLRKEASS